MTLEISLNEEYFKSDKIEHGRLIKKFFRSLSENVFEQSWRFYQEYQNITGDNWLPLLGNERNLYSIFSSAIDKITPIHHSELSFNKSDTPNANADAKSRRVDFWCLNKSGGNGTAINYFIEIKKGHYCLSKNTMTELNVATSNSIFDQKTGLVAQLQQIKKITPNWYGDADVYLGIVVIHGYHAANKDAEFNEKHIIDNVNELLDQRLGAQLVMNTWILPEELGVQWDSEKCKFISIVGIAISTKKL